MAGVLAAEYLRLVWRTNRFVLDPADFYERVAPELPVIIAMWHGQHFMAPFLKRAEHKVKVLISRHRDGEVNAIAVERLGVPAIRGSGDHERRFDRKGGVGAFKGMLDANGDCVASGQPDMKMNSAQGTFTTQGGTLTVVDSDPDAGSKNEQTTYCVKGNTVEVLVKSLDKGYSIHYSATRK